MSILENIVENKKQELQLSKKRDFISAITKSKDGMAVIAEIKKKSPSAGELVGDQNLINKAIEYEIAGANALSVVTDEKFFGGSFELFHQIRKATSLPVLMKDFIIHPLQLVQAEAIAADAILIIAALHKDFHPELISKIANTKITSVVEVASKDELSLPFVQQSHVIGVNARNLHTFEVDIERACSIIRKIPKDKIIIGFSGIRSEEEVKKYKDAGVRAVLVGEMLMKSDNVEQGIKLLKKI